MQWILSFRVVVLQKQCIFISSDENTESGEYFFYLNVGSSSAIVSMGRGGGTL